MKTSKTRCSCNNWYSHIEKVSQKRVATQLFHRAVDDYVKRNNIINPIIMGCLIPKFDMFTQSFAFCKILGFNKYNLSKVGPVSFSNQALRNWKFQRLKWYSEYDRFEHWKI